MSNSDLENNVVRVGRKPMVSMSHSRRSLTGTMDGGRTILTRKQNVVVGRPATANMTKMPTMGNGSMANTNSQMRQQMMAQQTNQPQLRQATQNDMSAMQKNQLQQLAAARMAQQREMAKMQQEKVQQAKMSSQEMKQEAISKVLNRVSKTEPKKKNNKTKVHFGFKRIVLATFCAAVAVFAIVYFVNLNAPNISLKVAAMQSGIEATYPAYVPRDFSLSDITSENGKVVLSFKNSSANESFTITEESSSWDSNALLSNFVKSEYGDCYTIIREQGLTLYVCDSNAAWVNSGVVYKLKTISGSLSKKQIKSIAVSL